MKSLINSSYLAVRNKLFNCFIAAFASHLFLFITFLFFQIPLIIPYLHETCKYMSNNDMNWNLKDKENACKQQYFWNKIKQLKFTNEEYWTYFWFFSLFSFFPIGVFVIRKPTNHIDLNSVYFSQRKTFWPDSQRLTTSIRHFIE